MKINRATPDKHEYLSALSYIPDTPKRIFFTGQLPSHRVPTVAIVGTRKPTIYGKEVTYRLASELAAKGVVIISGLALGIDALAHRGALEAGGITVAVLANSVDTIYPRSHVGLAEQIIKQKGAILSEYEPPKEARNYQFLARNRIISGLSDAVIIVEAASRSGTLNTASHALEQGKYLFAVPGNITSPLSAGCNTLIKQGAFPVTRTEDILEAIAPSLLSAQDTLPLGGTPEETTILSLIQSGIRDGEALHRASGLDAATFSQTLTMMELEGRIRALGANQWTIG